MIGLGLGERFRVIGLVEDWGMLKCSSIEVGQVQEID